MRIFDSELFTTWEEAVNTWLTYYPPALFTLSITPHNGTAVVGVCGIFDIVMWNPPLHVENFVIKNHKKKRYNKGVHTYLIGDYNDLRNMQKSTDRREKLNKILKK